MLREQSKNEMKTEEKSSFYVQNSTILYLYQHEIHLPQIKEQHPFPVSHMLIILLLLQLSGNLLKILLQLPHGLTLDILKKRSLAAGNCNVKEITANICAVNFAQTFFLRIPRNILVMM